MTSEFAYVGFVRNISMIFFYPFACQSFQNSYYIHTNINRGYISVGESCECTREPIDRS